jgi:hypothetical protein
MYDFLERILGLTFYSLTVSIMEIHSMLSQRSTEPQQTNVTWQDYHSGKLPGWDRA